MKQHTHTEPKTTTSDAVLNAIKERHIAPIPRWRFVLLNIGMWSSGVAAIIVGAIGVCMIIVVLSDTEFQLLGLRPHPELLILRTLPYVWVALLVIFIMLANRFVRHTRRGYVYAHWYVLVGTVCFSVVGGWGLYVAGVGHAIVTYLDDHRPPFHEIFIPQYAIWEDPQEGLLRGVVTHINSADAFTLRDPQGIVWSVDMSEAQVEGEVATDEVIHALGDEGEKHTFHAEVIVVPSQGHMMPPPHWHMMQEGERNDRD